LASDIRIDARCQSVAAIQRLAAAEIALIEPVALEQKTGNSADANYATALAAARPRLIKLERYKRAAFVNYLRRFRAYLPEIEKELFEKCVDLSRIIFFAWPGL